MNPYILLIFDLDGTLADSQKGIIRSVQYALDRLGIPACSTDKYRNFIGPPLYDSFRLFCGFDEEKVRLAVQYYREYYTSSGIFECALYPGIPDLLARLHNGCRTLALASSKPVMFAEQVLTHFHLREYFAVVAGGDADGSRVVKADLIRDILTRYPEVSCAQSVMIGDREYDIVGARLNSIPSIAVTYGYGAPEELTAARPDFIAHTIGELVTLVGECGEKPSSPVPVPAGWEMGQERIEAKEEKIP
ncbi:MAG: HAD hydrolase-like protein [Candidatus Latescibacterota bacterium]